MYIWDFRMLFSSEEIKIEAITPSGLFHCDSVPRSVLYSIMPKKKVGCGSHINMI